MALMYSFSFPYVCCITAAVPANPSTLVTVQMEKSFQQTEGTVGRKANGGRERRGSSPPAAWQVWMKRTQAGLPSSSSCSPASAREGLQALLALAEGKRASLSHGSACDGECEAECQGGHLGCSPRRIPPWAAWCPRQPTRLPPPPETPCTLSHSPAYPGTVTPWRSPHRNLCSRLLYSPPVEQGPHLLVEISAARWGNKDV